MDVVKAKLNHLRIAPRKVRMIADMIRGKKVTEALSLLDFSVKSAAEPMLKLLNSAVANNKQNEEFEEESLEISKIAVDEGAKLKRWRARSRGRAGAIQKKTSCITIELKGKKIEQKQAKEKKKDVEKIERVKTKAKPDAKAFNLRKDAAPTKLKSTKKSIFRRKSF